MSAGRKLAWPSVTNDAVFTPGVRFDRNRLICTVRGLCAREWEPRDDARRRVRGRAILRIRCATDLHTGMRPDTEAERRWSWMQT
jgi:hypothetical protein